MRVCVNVRVAYTDERARFAFLFISKAIEAVARGEHMKVWLVVTRTLALRGSLVNENEILLFDSMILRIAAIRFVARRRLSEVGVIVRRVYHHRAMRRDGTKYHV